MCRALRIICLLTCVFSPQGNATSVLNTTLEPSALFATESDGRFFIVTLLEPHHVFSTSPVNGGATTKVQFLINHQSMEADDSAELARILSLGKRGYHLEVAEKLELPPEQMALMGTAVSMHNLAHVQRCFEALCVDAFVTAGTERNALRAGDPARWYETKSGNQRVDLTVGESAPIDVSGTINTIVLINHPVQPGALLKVSMVAVEAKSAALAELAIPSQASSHLATGTGTDQIVVAAPLAADQEKPMSSASGHLKLGELVGSAVRLATREALLRQSYAEPADTATVEHALGRFGWTQTLLMEAIQAVANDKAFRLAHEDIASVSSDVRVVAAAFAYAAVLDRIEYGVLPESGDARILSDQAAQVAVVVSGEPGLWLQYRQQLAELGDPPELFARAIALGLQSKWLNQ